ncbi:MAG: methionine synthase, partial [Tissierellia bacterium]|nr:methionine synthase [Tissierellia bacterium]
MDLNFVNIKKNEILKNLQYRGSEIPEDIDYLIFQSIVDLEKYSKPKYKYIELDKDLEELKEILLGEDIKDLLSTSRKVVLMGVTLGREIEMLTRKYSFSDLVRSVILDATASAGVESLANDINDEIKNIYKPMYLTDRFSPGYGDLPISVQKKFLNLINGEKDLGITTTESGIMIPRKSITAIIGISDKKQPRRRPGCENCR